MNIKEHGAWAEYKPEIKPAHLLNHNVIFMRRESDGRDWYDYQRNVLVGLDTIKLTLWKSENEWVVMSTTPDSSMLFPMNMRVLEIDYRADHESLRQHRFDDATKTFKPPLPPAPSPLERYGYLLKAIMEELGWDDTKTKRVLDRSLAMLNMDRSKNG